MENSFDIQRELHQLLDEGLDAIAANSGKAAATVFADIERRFDNLSYSSKNDTYK